jgi:hypothetical protein
MPDIAKCQNAECPSCGDCWRYISPSSEYQYYSDFKPEEGEDQCDYFIDATMWISWQKK